MARIPLEDSLADIITKALRGLNIDAGTLARRAGISDATFAAALDGSAPDDAIRRIARHLQLHPGRLLAFARKPPLPETPPLPRGLVVFNTPFGNGLSVNNCLLMDPRSRQAAVFDTGAACCALLDVIADEKADVRRIFITHAHPDHIARLRELSDKLPSAEIWMHELEPFDGAAPNIRRFPSNACFHTGRVVIKPLHIGGHSPGMTAYRADGLSAPLAITGDSIFSGSAAGCDAPAFRAQLKNIREKILSLPRQTLLVCGHGPLTTVAHERLHNPFF
ncbi:MAG: MBL fold metallo-hydrolase [Opitutaceae bacterium]|jgi:glyoxylase-like metal-dependent hydrolase (beta-lactamase superfamily II)|nr:MBL fold metallo-hydrolase [Opitutaceae bacterium]